MMESLTQGGQEEYIWAMRMSGYRAMELLEDTKSKRSHLDIAKLSSGVGSASTLQGEDDQQTKVIASLVPDEVIFNFNDYTHRRYEACFLFGDISGFTEVCERYSKTGISGPSRMSQALNKYLGSMVQEVMSHNGDVLKFSGDAFLALFKATENEIMRDAVHQAIDCALVIQKNYGSYLTDVGVVIRVKLAISAGKVTFSLIGDMGNSHYVVVGNPIWDVKAAESISVAGDIIVAPAAWRYVTASHYLYKVMPDGVHVCITGIGPSWRSVQKNVRQQIAADDTTSTISSLTSEVMTEFILHDVDEYTLRPGVNTAVRLGIKSDLRKFIITPVMNSIDMNEPFEYLTEMRQTVIVFINIVFKKLQDDDIVTLADKSYKIVCRVVQKMRGCVNKVSLFDKDMMFVVIFGLRGLKHELECQAALRSARECHEAIVEFPEVLSASIGVTTGKTYCGVIGHTLRREYTVISLIVNKAARLMVAYKGKVTCDRETFLHSKLEARHFILQEAKALKGISRVGPVYEFVDIELDHDTVQRVNACPILGRKDKLTLYSQLLENCFPPRAVKSCCKMLVIRGDARQGKTRLLDELIYITPPEILVSKFTLTAKDSEVPYQTIKLLFYGPLDLNTDSTSAEREQKLLKALSKVEDFDLLFILNKIFDVSFLITDLTFKEKEKDKALKKMIKQLCEACFESFWVLAIDNCEFIDDESWNLLDIFFDIDTVFIIATMGRSKLVGAVRIHKCLHDVRVKVVGLKPTSRDYLGALACQILDVYAISPELEKAIQTKSNGNPGWIESFLISLIQDQALFILAANLEQINRLGLVSPPLYMMTRLTKQETIKWQSVMEERRASMDSMLERNYWKKYVDTCRGSDVNVALREGIESISHGKKVPICVIGPNFKLDIQDSELSVDAMILKTFDSLNSFEQLLIKCSSVLGNKFMRDMLLYVMLATDKRKAALAVQKLFEMRVLSCATRDVLEESLSKATLTNPAEEMISCQCKSIKFEESCADLPKYASCSYLQFTSSQFREITYNLLTDNQMKDFHQRAIKYLERETRRCKACGNIYFSRILGLKFDKDLRESREKEKRVINLSTSWESVRSTMSTRSSAFSFGQLSRGSSRRTLEEKSIASFPSQIFGVTKDKVERVQKAWFGFTIINKLKDSYSLTKVFSSEDFSDCQCILILNTTYAQLDEHCKCAGNLSKLLEVKAQYAKISIALSNIPLAMRILNEALQVVEDLRKTDMENKWKLNLARARYFTLKGYSRMKLGQLDEAQTDFHNSLAEYNIVFPQGFGRKIKICFHQLKQLFGLYITPVSLLKRLDYWETTYANHLSECLAHLCTLYRIKGEWDQAELAASWSFTRAMEAYSDFQVICTACTNMLRVAQHYHRWNLCIALEVHSLRICHVKRSRIDLRDMQCVAKLYSAIFASRLQRANIDKAVHIGYILLRLCSSTRATRIVLPVLPLMWHSLLFGKQLSNVLSILHELDYFSEDDADYSGRLWYFSLCIAFHLETGYTFVSYQACEKFYLVEGENWKMVMYPEARTRYFAVMWLWCARNDRWEEAALWWMKTEDLKVIMSANDTLANKITALYVLEGMILFLVYHLDKSDLDAAAQAHTQIKVLIKEIAKATKHYPVILPRFYHLKAYYQHVINSENAFDLLETATKYATQFGNFMEVSWIEHSTKAWSKTLPISEIDFWREHSEPDSLLEFETMDLAEEKCGYFTLPTPFYYDY